MKIEIADYRDEWKDLFLMEKKRITLLLFNLTPEIIHIGSTSVPGLCAKPVIDIQVGLQQDADLDKTIEPMRKHYTYVKVFEPDWPSRRFYCTFKSVDDKQIPSIIDLNELPPSAQNLLSTVNIHVFVKDLEDWDRHIAFKEYLLAHDDVRDAYCRLKKELSKKEYDNIIVYNNDKDDFIKQVEQKALKWFRLEK